MRLLMESRLWSGLKALVLLQFFGTAGYFVLGQLHLKLLAPHIERGWTLLDCIYMTVITISTIGYGEVFPTPAGTTMEDFPLVRWYTIGLILVAMILVAYSVSSATAFLVNGELQRLFERRRAMKKISRLSGHQILCGCGTVGRVILQELVDSGAVVVVIDASAEALADFAGLDDVITLEGDATDDETLRAAGIERAGGLAATMGEDKDNLFLIVSAKQLRPEIRVASVASDLKIRDKLIRAGADAVVSPAFIGGLRLASELMRPAVVGFLDKMLRKTDSPCRFAQVSVGAAWFGKTLRELDSPNTEGLPVLAVKLPGGEFLFNPSRSTPLAKGMEIVTMGEISRVQLLMARIGDMTAPTIIGAADGDDDDDTADGADG